MQGLRCAGLQHEAIGFRPRFAENADKRASTPTPGIHYKRAMKLQHSA
jgi:hypothetical protein